MGRRWPTTSPTAYRLAHECDTVSAFGGIVAVNRPLPVALAEALAPVFTEVVIAPGYEDGALEVLAARKNLRILEARHPAHQACRCARSTAASWSRPPTR